MSWLLSHSGVPACVADMVLERYVCAVEQNPDADEVCMRLRVSDKQEDVAKTEVDECRAVRRANGRSSISDLTIFGARMTLLNATKMGVYKRLRGTDAAAQA